MSARGIGPGAFRRLRADLLLFMILATLGIALANLTASDARQAARELQVTAAAHREIIDKVSRMREEERWWRDSIVRFRQLSEDGILGPEHRQEWIDELHRIGRERNLIGLQYALGPSHVLPDARTSSAEHRALASPMKLRMALLHEGELLDFLDALKTGASAILRVRRCTIQRSQAPAMPPSPPTPLQADCELAWITLSEPAP